MSVVGAFVAALGDGARERFADAPDLAATLALLHDRARASYPELAIDAPRFAAELARRLGGEATPAQLATLRADHVYLAIACVAGDEVAIRRFEAELFDEVGFVGARMGCSALVDEVRGYLRDVLFISLPNRPAALCSYAGRGDLRSYLRVITTRELVRLSARARRHVLADDAISQLIAPAGDPALEIMRARYRDQVDVAIRDAFAGLSEASRALLRYSLIDGWSIDRIGTLYGIHRATAARRIAGARDELARAIRSILASRLAIPLDEVDSVVRMVQSVIDLSLEQLLFT